MPPYSGNKYVECALQTIMFSFYWAAVMLPSWAAVMVHSWAAVMVHSWVAVMVHSLVAVMLHGWVAVMLHSWVAVMVHNTNAHDAKQLVWLLAGNLHFMISDQCTRLNAQASPTCLCAAVLPRPLDWCWTPVQALSVETHCT